MNFKEHKDSSSIKSTNYNSNKNELTVVFKNGNEYVYENVNSRVYSDLLEADSLGSYLNKNIVRNPKFFPFKKVEKKEKK